MRVELPDDVADYESDWREHRTHTIPDIGDVAEILEPPVDVVGADGRTVAIYRNAGDRIWPDNLRTVLPALPHTRNRQGVWRVTFGPRARKAAVPTMNYGYRSVLEMRYPGVVKLLTRQARKLDRWYSRRLPIEHDAQRALFEDFDRFWKLGNSCWSSGVINHSAIPYHWDTPNHRPSLNAMVFARHGAEGGHLLVPSWGIGFASGDSHVLLHDPFFLHGVSPFTVADGGYRLSVAYYVLNDVLRAGGVGTMADELNRANRALEV